ncbi:MAG: hypothetical protein ACOYM2_06515 [Rectinemataceae bacterium]
MMESWPWYYWFIAVAMLGAAWQLRKKSDRAKAQVLGPGTVEGGEASPATTAASVTPGGQAGATQPPAADALLVAVIAAAVSAASGLSPDKFRITNIREAQGLGGFNTPVWSWADRLARGYRK